MKIKGLSITMVFEANSANYGESIGNVSSLKKVSRNAGEQYTYISRQALRYNIVEQLGYSLADVIAVGSGDKKVIQYDKSATITDYPELDFFGYMKTESEKLAKTRNAKVRLSHAISTDTFKGDLDFLTNKGLADRKNEYMNISQAEIHHSYYGYTMSIDLDQIGIDETYDIRLPNSEKSQRVQRLLDTVQYLYRDIRGRREDLKPLFAIGGVYDIKNPIFQNAIEIKKNEINVSAIENRMMEGTLCGLLKGKFNNDDEIEEKLNAIHMPDFFEELKKQVADYYLNAGE